MARVKAQNNPKYKEMHRKICAFVFPETNEVYVDRTVAKDLWRYFDGHYRERNQITAPAIRQCKECGLLPGLYLLEEIFGTDSEAFGHCIAWAKCFSEAGYELMGSKMDKFVAEMDDETEEIYRSVQNIPIQEICSEEANLFPNFKNCGSVKRLASAERKSEKHRIAVHVTDSEYKKIKERAAEYGVSMSEYILDCVRLGGVFQIDTAFLEEYVRRVDQDHALLEGMLATYLISGDYYPADIAQMDLISKRIEQSNNAVAKEFIRLNKQLRALKTGTLTTKNPLE